MRPLHLLLVVAVLAAVLLAALSFLGRGSTNPTSPPATVAPASEVAPGEGEPASSGIHTAALDTTGANAESSRAATPASLVSPAPTASGAPAPKPKPTVALSGRVVGDLGKPIAGATVYAADRSELWTGPLDEIDPVRDTWMRRVDATTDADGRFKIRPEAGSRVSFAVRAPGFAPLDREFTVTTSERDLGDLAMDASVILSGRVVSTSGRPIEHARIARLSAQGDAFAFFGRPRGATLAETDAQGTFRVDQLSAGPWHLLVSEEDHPDLVQSGETERPGTVVNDLLFTLADGADIRGRISGAPPGAAEKLVVRAVPKSGEEGIAMDNPAAFSAGPRTARCAADGTFAVKGLRKDDAYKLVARDAGREPFGGVRSSAVNARAGDRGVELLYQPETALVFQAVDAKSGKPVADLDVQAGRSFTLPLLDEVGRPIRHFPDGRVRFGALPPSGHGRTGDDASGLKLRIEAAGYQVFERSDIAALEGQDNDLGVVRLEPAPVVRVLVLDASTKAPVADAQVTLVPEEPETNDARARVGITIGDDEDDGDLDATGSAHRARTGSDGRAVVTSFPGKSARLRVRHSGHSEFRGDPIALPEKDDLEQTVSLGNGGSVTVVVVDPRGHPVAAAEVEHEGPDRSGEERVLSGRPNRTDADGKLAFDHLQPGSHRFRIGGKSGNGVFNVGGGHAVMRRVVRGGDSSAEGWASVEVTEGSQDGLRLVAPEKGSLSGKITEAGKPLANATVRLGQRGAPAMPFMDEGQSARTDGTGDYLLDGVEEGEYTLTVEHATRSMPFENDARVRAGENKLDLDLPLAIVEGTVTGEDGKPVSGVRMRAERANPSGGRRTMMAVMVTADGSGDPEVTVGSPGGSDARSITDENGKYSLRGVLADADIVVLADPKDAQPARSETFKVKPDETKKGLDLKLERGGSLQIAVARAGKPAGGFLARAVLVDGDPAPKIQFVGPSGSAKLSGLKPGKWRVSLDPIQGAIGSKGSGEIPDQEIDVHVGETARATFDVP